jgi:hypothetical protein
MKVLKMFDIESGHNIATALTAKEPSFLNSTALIQTKQ